MFTDGALCTVYSTSANIRIAFLNFSSGQTALAVYLSIKAGFSAILNVMQ